MPQPVRSRGLWPSNQSLIPKDSRTNALLSELQHLPDLNGWRSFSPSKSLEYSSKIARIRTASSISNGRSLRFYRRWCNRTAHRCDKRLQRLQKKIFVNAFIILSTFVSIKITWAKRSKIMTGSQAKIVHCVRKLVNSGHFCKTVVTEQYWSKTFFHSLTMKKLLLEFGIIQIIGLIFKLTLCARLLLVYKRLQSFS